MIYVTKEKLNKVLVILQNQCPEADFGLEYAFDQVRLVRSKQSVSITHFGTRKEVYEWMRMVIFGIDISFDKILVKHKLNRDSTTIRSIE